MRQTARHSLLLLLTILGFVNSCTAAYRTVCYMASWARYRQDPVTFVPEDVDTSLCTHVLFAFGFLDSTGLHIVPDDPGDLEMYRRLTNLKRERPNLKVMLALGGWEMGSEEFTELVSSTSNMHAFTTGAIEFLHSYNFDGIDIDWEYPAARGSPAEDKQAFTTLLRILFRAFRADHTSTNRTRLLLSAAIAPMPYRTAESYELPDIADFLDFINVMTYDIHGPWDSEVGHHSALYSSSENAPDTVDYLIDWLVSSQIPPNKMNLGIPFYGVSLNLSDPSQTDLGSPILGDGVGGPLLGDTGSLAYYEICTILSENPDIISRRIPGTSAPYIVYRNSWIGYDDVNSVQEKVDYVVDNQLGGVMVWTVDMDDFHGICGLGQWSPTFSSPRTGQRLIILPRTGQRLIILPRPDDVGGR